jgi:hypothetical protein
MGVADQSLPSKIEESNMNNSAHSVSSGLNKAVDQREIAISVEAVDPRSCRIIGPGGIYNKV